jgi:hypothetical protein
MLPALLAGVLAAALAAGAGAWQVRGWQCDAARTRSVENAIAQAAALAAQDAALHADIDTASAVRSAAVETRYQIINRELIRYVAHPRDPIECLDADGLRLWRDANRAADAETEAGSHPDPPLSAVAAAGLGAGDGPAEQPHRNGAAVSAVPREAAGLGAASDPLLRYEF